MSKTNSAAKLKHVFDDDVFHLVAYGEKNNLLVGFSNGRVANYSYDTENNSLVEEWNTKRHKISCRNLSLTEDNSEFISVGSDCVLKLADTASGRVTSKWIQETASTELSPYSVVEWVEGNNIFATGDDDGCVTIWDRRKSGGVLHSHRDQIDYISSICPFEDRYMVATSGDGTLSILDSRNFKTAVLSEEQDDDLTCGAFTRDNNSKKKFAVGTASGVVTLFTKGDWGDHTDRIVPPIRSNDYSIETMNRAGTDTLYIGGSDGCLRQLNILPNRYEKVIGQHTSKAGVDTADVSENGEFLISASGSELIFWNKGDDSAEFEKAGQDGEEDSDAMNSDESEDDVDSDSDEPTQKSKRNKKLAKAAPKKKAPRTDFFDGL
ncbi:WD repeat protein, WDR55 family, involved in ribosome biogenesis [Schizosaccharomyces osmophilus]|uniref:WD repeat protein, WDR55 family, involved in ribosome biogenesis n=1 Tax=Schizosaccharomyces osmophilus TaxID=2545709 RepID=A0AAE9W8S8_9SCHI|nr:WD repeat protein, WDR55 family, involved in ribosome biogenesis [Schizosaccharomyces osmophilus]WBW71801.1 WD repeat protein, WDR55 family, involved in ribosome biogenesis [Schizosaccharomyces osmophilus]